MTIEENSTAQTWPMHFLVNFMQKRKEKGNEKKKKKKKKKRKKEEKKKKTQLIAKAGTSAVMSFGYSLVW